MPSDQTLHQLDALNNWLGDVYGEGTNFSTLLLDRGFSLLAGYTDLANELRNRVMIEQRYGLIDGKPIGHDRVGLVS